MSNFLNEIKRIIKSGDTTAKLVCLLAAVVLWTYVNNIKMGDVRYKVPVEFKNLSNLLMVADADNKFVSVTISGKKEDLKNVSLKNLRAFVNLDNAVIGENQRFPVEFIKNNIPDSLSVDFSRQKIYLTIEKKQSKQVRVVTKLSGDLFEGYIHGTPRVFPQYITIYGAESRLADINEVYTNSVSLSDQNKSISKEVSIDTEYMNDVICEVKRVSVSIPVIDGTGLVKIDSDIKVHSDLDTYKFSLKDVTAAVYCKPLKDNFVVTSDIIEAYIEPDVKKIELQLAQQPTALSTEIVCPVICIVKSQRDAFRPVLIVPDTVVVKAARK